MLSNIFLNNGPIKYTYFSFKLRKLKTKFLALLKIHF